MPDDKRSSSARGCVYVWVCVCLFVCVCVFARVTLFLSLLSMLYSKVDMIVVYLLLILTKILPTIQRDREKERYIYIYIYLFIYQQQQHQQQQQHVRSKHRQIN